MARRKIDSVCVVGAGVTGHGIAQCSAQSGLKTVLVDVDTSILTRAEGSIKATLRTLIETGLASREDLSRLEKSLTFSTDLAGSCADAAFVIEAVPERKALKQEVFKRLEAVCPRDAILASNTSGIPITGIAEALATRDRVVGTHFYTPTATIPLVEVIRGPETSDETVETAVSLLTTIGKTPVRVNADIPGFVGNRLQHALMREAFHLVETGVASPQDIDTVARLALGLRLVFSGPFEQRDINGLDIHLSICEYLYPSLSDAKTPSGVLIEKVQSGALGLKTGRGFYDWSSRDASEVMRQKNRDLLELIRFVKARTE